MKMKSGLVSSLVLSMVFSAFAFSTRSEAGEFAKKHPRRAQVLHRANNEENKNNSAAANGQITQKQADKLDRQDQRIKREEQRDAREHGGHITPGEQARMNRQENQVNRERNRMEKRDAAAGGAQPPAPVAPAPAGN